MPPPASSTTKTAAASRPRRQVAAAKRQQRVEKDPSSSSSSSDGEEEEEEEQAPPPPLPQKKAASRKPPAAPKRKAASIPKEADDNASASAASAAPSSSPEQAVRTCFNNLDSALDVPRETDRACALLLSSSPSSDAVAGSFIHCWHAILLEYKLTPQLALCVELVQSVVSRQPSEFQVDFLLQHVTPHCRAKDRAVRLRSVHLMRAWLRAQTEIHEDLHDTLLSCLMDCTLDKNALVRQEACAGLEFFQDPTEPKDRVIHRLCQLAREDNTAAVRKTCVRVLVPSEPSILTLVARTRDESAEVRQQVFRELRDRFQIEWFSSSLLVQVFDQGLADGSPPVRQACEAVLSKWFLAKQNNVLRLLECFDVNEENERTMLRVLAALPHSKHKKRQGEEEEFAGDTTESALCLRFFCRPEEDGDVGLLDTLLRMLRQELRSQLGDEDATQEVAFICKNLLVCLARVVGDFDRASKDRVQRELAHTLLADDFPVSLVEHILPVLFLCHGSSFVFDLVTNTLSQLTEQSPLDQTRADLARAHQLVEQYTKEKKYAQLQDACEEIKQLQLREQELVLQEDEPSASSSFNKLERACAVACGMYRCLPRGGGGGGADSSSLLGSVLDMVCLPCVQSSEPAVRALAVDLLGLISLGDVAVCQSHGMVLAMSLLDNESQGEHDVVRARAMRAIFDLLLCHGARAVASPEEFDLLVQHLMGFLAVGVSDELRTVAAHGLSKLLFLNRVAYPGLVQCLLIVLFHPTSSHSELRQCLTTFFAEYCNAPAVLLASEPLIEAILFPTADSLCEDLPLDLVLDRLAFLLRDVPNGWAELLLNKIAQHAQHEHIKVLVKSVSSVAVVASGTTTTTKLRYFAQLVAAQLVAAEQDKTSVNRMGKFVAHLCKLESGGAAGGGEVDEATRQEVHARFPTPQALQECLKQLAKQPKEQQQQQQEEEEEEEEEEDDDEEQDDEA